MLPFPVPRVNGGVLDPLSHEPIMSGAPPAQRRRAPRKQHRRQRCQALLPISIVAHKEKSIAANAQHFFQDRCYFWYDGRLGKPYSRDQAFVKTVW